MCPLWGRYWAAYLSRHTISGPHDFLCEGGGTIIGTRKRLLHLFIAIQPPRESQPPPRPTPSSPHCACSLVGDSQTARQLPTPLGWTLHLPVSPAMGTDIYGVCTAIPCSPARLPSDAYISFKKTPSASQRTHRAGASLPCVNSNTGWVRTDSTDVSLLALSVLGLAIPSPQIPLSQLTKSWQTARI